MILNLEYLVKTFHECPSCKRYPILVHNTKYSKIICPECKRCFEDIDLYSAIEKWKKFTESINK